MIFADRHLDAQIRQTLGHIGLGHLERLSESNHSTDIVIMSSALLSRYKSREINKLQTLRKGRKLLVVLTDQTITKIVEAMQIADGVICEQPDLGRLPMIITLMEEGHMSVPAHIASIMIERGLRRKILLSLTCSEQRILRLLRHGCTNSIIAATLEISEGRAKYLIRSLLKKLLLHNRTQAAVFAAREIKLIEPAKPRDDGPLTA
jgi:DNA-binding NarL/FixJ family response regulator